MKSWFKYEFGFINIDEANLYLTNTGNWSETKKLSEQICGDSSKASNRRKGKAMVYLIIFGSLLLMIFLAQLILTSLNSFSLILLLGIPAGGYMAYQYIKTELGNSFYIPIHKVTGIIVNDKKVIIEFLDKENAVCSESLIGVGNDGIEQLRALFPDQIPIFNEQL